MSQAIVDTLKKIEQFLEVVEAKVAEATSQGKAIPVTKLAKEVGPSFGWEWPQAYQVISAYADERADLVVKRGPSGGLSSRVKDVVVEEGNKKE